MYPIDCELDSQDEDYLLKMGIDKDDCINKLYELNTFGVVYLMIYCILYERAVME